ncbi:MULTISPECIES: sensor histidine kinase [Bacillaceae]|uniref:sensor histidine kinase n=1 Tax=Bacillaceae TaxID=186817 RepID=UPI000BFD9729|nr:MULTISPECIES: histidine kinase [Bacillaceae]PGT89769.1 sensor histidine kinase [Bacillus sp. AFS040349]UGB31982.1 histidine kinase [Metabacillus sp. B2-18]
MITYESFFLIILFSIIGPVFGFLALIFYNLYEKQVSLLQVENRQITLEKELETSRYMQLNQQIQPHFLFNSLNSLYSLLRLQKYDKLSKSFEHMVLFLRSKYQEKDSLYPLQEEISYTEHYLEIQKIRFGDRLSINWEIDSASERALIIPYLLQTLVENAFKHGLEVIEGELVLTILIEKTNAQSILLHVKDNGPGFRKESAPVSGIGLSNIEKRLSLLFGNEGQIHITYENYGHISVEWPYIEKTEEGVG